MKNIMQEKQSRILLTLLLSLALCLGLLSGCNRASQVPSDTAQTAETAESSPEADYETFDENTQKTREDFDALCEEIFQNQITSSFLSLHYTLAEPETYGITDYPIRFEDISPEARQKQRDLLTAWQTSLNSLDSTLLTEEQQLTWQILTYATSTELADPALDLYAQHLAPAIGVQAQLPVLLAEYKFYKKSDIDNYLTLLSTIDDYYRQFLDFEKERAAAGLFMPDSCVDSVVAECQAYLLPANHNFMTSTFDQRIDAMEGLTDEERAAYKSRNAELVTSDFIPAYQLLLDGLTQLKESCTNELGLCYFPEGKRYYEYLVNSNIGTTYDSIEDLQKAVEAQMDADLVAMSSIIRNNPDILQTMDQYTFSYEEPDDILRGLTQMIGADFPEISDYTAVCKYVPSQLEATLSPAFFLVPPIDRFQDCTIYINKSALSDTQPLFTTMAHEGLPGHLYQNVYFLSNCKSQIRRILSFTGYSEGWATYVENCSYTFEDNGLSPEQGELLALNASASLGLHALMDMNINYFGWNKDQMSAYLEDFYGVSQPEVVDSIFESMLSAPANYLNYYVGYLEIRNMRTLAEETLGNRFSAKEFHQFLLDIGPAPFTVIEPRFRTWLMTYHLR